MGRKLRNGKYGACFCNKNDSSSKILIDSLASTLSTANKKVVATTNDTNTTQNPSTLNETNNDNNTKNDNEKKWASNGTTKLVSSPPYQEKPFLIFATRPGRRIWLANGQTQSVLCTLKPVLEMKQTCFRVETECIPTQSPSLEFGKIMRFQSSIPLSRLGGNTLNTAHNGNERRQSVLLSWNSSTILIINPDIPAFTGTRVLQWHIDLGNIHDLAVCSSNCEEDGGGFYILHGEKHLVSRVISLNPKQILNSHYSKRMGITWCFENAIKCNILSLPVLQELLSRLNTGENINIVEDDLRTKFMEQIEMAKDAKEKNSSINDMMMMKGGNMRRNSLTFSPALNDPFSPGTVYRNSGLLMRSPPQSPPPITAIASSEDVENRNDLDAKLKRFDELLRNTVSRWKDIHNNVNDNDEEDNQNYDVDNSNAKRHYRIKRMAFDAKLTDIVPKAIPEDVKTRADLKSWGEEVVRALNADANVSTKLAANFEQAAMDAMAKVVRSKGSVGPVKKAKKRKKKSTAINDKKKDGKLKSKRKGGSRRERLVSIDDLSEEDLLRRSQISNASMMSQRADKNKKVEKALEPFQGAINAMAKSTVSTASKAMKDFSVVLNTAETNSNLHKGNANVSFNDTNRDDELDKFELALNKKSAAARPVSKPWRQIRQKKRDESIDTPDAKKLDSYVKRVAKETAKSKTLTSATNKKNTNNTNVSGNGLLGWFSSSNSTVVVSSKASSSSKNQNLSNLRSKRTAHVKYEKIDGFEDVIRITRSDYAKNVMKKKAANKLKPDPSALLTCHVYNYVLVHLKRGQLISSEPVLSAFVQTFCPILKHTLKDSGSVDRNEEKVEFTTAAPISKNQEHFNTKTTNVSAANNNESKEVNATTLVAAAIMEEEKQAIKESKKDEAEDDDITFQTTRPLTDTERAKAMELVTIYFELHCANQNNDNERGGIASVDGKYLKAWNDSIVERFINEYWDYLNIDRVMITVCKRKSIKIFDYIQNRLSDYAGIGSHRLFAEAMDQNDIDRVFAALEHWQSTYYSLVDNSTAVPPLSCLFQPEVLRKLVGHNAEKASSLIIAWYEWICPWVLFQVILDVPPTEVKDISSISKEISSWYCRLFQSIFSTNAKDASGNPCTKNEDLLTFWLELEIQNGDAKKVDQIVCQYDCNASWFLNLCKEKQFMPGMLSLLKSLCRKYDQSAIRGNALAGSINKKLTYVTAIEISALEIVDFIMAFNGTNNNINNNGAAVLVILFQSLATRLADKYVLSLVKKLCTCSPENLLDNYLTSAFTGIIKGIGETKTTKMIGNLDVGIKKLLPLKVCEIIFDANAKKNARNQEMYDLLGTIDNYMWKKREPMLGPQIRHLKNIEHEYRYGNRENLSGKVPKSIESLLSSGGMLMDNVNGINEPFIKFYADEGCHWGTGTNVKKYDEFGGSTGGSTESKEYNHRIGVGNICPRCNCPYEPGDRIVFFPCGHGAHKNCCREGICTICLCMNNTK